MASAGLAEDQYRAPSIRDDALNIARKWSEKAATEMPGQVIPQALTLAEKNRQAREAEHRTHAQKKAVEEQERQELWEKLLDLKASNSDEDLADLDDATKEMTAAYKEFQEHLGIDEVALKGARPRLSDIKDALNRWGGPEKEDKPDPEYSNANDALSAVCETLDRYSTLFDWFPAGDRYASILAGTLSSIVKATLNHRKIGNGFVMAMNSIGRILRICGARLDIFRDTDNSSTSTVGMRRIVAEILTKVFNFLTPYMKWCGSKMQRFKASLDKRYYENNVQVPLNKIVTLADDLRDEATMQSQRVILGIEKAVDDQRHEFQNFERRNAIYRQQSEKKDDEKLAELQQKMDQILAIGGIAIQTVQSNAEAFLWEREQQRFRTTLARRDSNMEMGVRRKTSMGPPARPQKVRGLHQYEHLEIEMASRHLAAYNSGFLVDDSEGGFEAINATPETAMRIRDWISAKTSQWLWLCGPLWASRPSELSQIAESLVKTAMRLNIPIIAYRCGQDYPERERASSPKMNQFVSMAYSIIRQIVWLLPDSIKTEGRYGPERFAALDGSDYSLEDALQLIEGLLPHVPSPLLCVLDGFEMVDNDEDPEGTGYYLEALLGILRDAGEFQSQVIKVFLSSNGLCWTLSKEDVVELDEQLDLMGGGSRSAMRFLLEDAEDDE